MRKFITFFLLSIFLAGFAGCSSDDDKNDDDDTGNIFVWDGDWNDPDDPKYKPEYGGKYNPIEGVWRQTDDMKMGFKYTKDFKTCTVWFSSGSNNNYTEGTITSYTINETAYYRQSITYIGYKLTDGKLYAAIQHIGKPINENWVIYEKVEEE